MSHSHSWGDRNDHGGHKDGASVVANHYNQIQEVGIEARKESRIFFMRNFNNWTKSMIISETLERIRRGKDDWRAPVTVLDIACGKGGDLRKYKIGKINHLICSDIAETSLAQCEDRYREMQSFSGGRGRGRGQWGGNRGWGNNRNNGRNNNDSNLFTAEFILADSTRERLRDKFRDQNIKLDMVSCQFAFHYSFESMSQVEMMLKNASENLVDGGYFIGTTPDANEIMRRIRESKSNSFGNGIFSVTFKDGVINDDKPPPLFGAEYNFHLEEVVDCPEFLVHFACLESLAAKFGLKLVYKQRFDEFYQRMKDSKEGAPLLKRMKALETYPPFAGDPVGTSSDDYVHAQKFLESVADDDNDQDGRNRNGHIKIGPCVGTLSKSEWEAITLYTVFVFKKESSRSSDEPAAKRRRT